MVSCVVGRLCGVCERQADVTLKGREADAERRQREAADVASDVERRTLDRRCPNCGGAGEIQTGGGEIKAGWRVCEKCAGSGRVPHSQPALAEIGIQARAPTAEEAAAVREAFEAADPVARRPVTKTLEDVQHEVGAWAREQFGDNVSKDDQTIMHGHAMDWVPAVFGMVEELGELCRVLGRRIQGRFGGDSAKARADIEDALADQLVFTCDFASRWGVDLTAALNKAWGKVSKRRAATYVADKEREALEEAAEELGSELKDAGERLRRERARLAMTRFGSLYGSDHSAQESWLAADKALREREAAHQAREALGRAAGADQTTPSPQEGTPGGAGKGVK